MHTRKSEAGFALLITMVVVGVILSVGLSILDLSIKQVKLSTNAKESEVAFHAANAGMECGRYWRRQSAAEMTVGDPVSPSCFATTPTFSALSQFPAAPGAGTRVAGDGEAFMYTYAFTWGAVPDQRCTALTTLVASTTSTGAGATVTNMSATLAGYKSSGNDWYCAPGSRCTVIAVRGYNKPCNAITGYGVIEREVLLQF